LTAYAGICLYIFEAITSISILLLILDLRGGFTARQGVGRTAGRDRSQGGAVSPGTLYHRFACGRDLADAPCAARKFVVAAQKARAACL
jgi:hypothetical protein